MLWPTTFDLSEQIIHEPNYRIVIADKTLMYTEWMSKHLKYLNNYTDDFQFETRLNHDHDMKQNKSKVFSFQRNLRNSRKV